MENKGQIVATDRDRWRLAPIFERLKRAETRNVQVREAGAALDDLAGRMDAVLIDAPCTGTGTWRRRPDAKWRLTERAVGERVAEQRAILADAARYLKPGGRLVYVTCSLLPEENGDQIEAFLAEHGDFRILDSEAMAARMAQFNLGPGDVTASKGAILPAPDRHGRVLCRRSDALTVGWLAARVAPQLSDAPPLMPRCPLEYAAEARREPLNIPVPSS